MLFLPSSPILAGRQPEDEVDKLFHQLPQIEPSGELIARILSRVRSLPGPLWQPERLAPSEYMGSDTLIVRNEKHDPS